MTKTDTGDDEVVDQVKRILDGEQKRDNTVFPAAFPGEGEHQMKGLFAEVNPIHVGEAEGFKRQQRVKAAHAAGDALADSVSPRESIVRSGTNDDTRIERTYDTTVAGDRVVGRYSERMGITTDPLRDPSANPLVPDPQKVDPRSGVQRTTNEPEPLAAVLRTDGSGVVVDELNKVDPTKEAKRRDKSTLEADVEDPDGIDSQDPDDKKSYEDVEPLRDDIGQPLVLDEDGEPLKDEQGNFVVDTDRLEREKEQAEAAEAAAEEQSKQAAEIQQQGNSDPAFDVDSANLDDLRAEATRRNIEGRAGMNKPDLVKAIKKDQKKNP